MHFFFSYLDLNFGTEYLYAPESLASQLVFKIESLCSFKFYAITENL